MEEKFVMTEVSLMPDGSHAAGGYYEKNQSHKQWLDNEYSEWIKALQESTVHNFKEHPMVQRMLSEDVNPQLFKDVMHLQHILLPIDNIGRETLKPVSGACLRMAYYALKVLDMVKDIENPSIVEIGGGVGQFYVILRALGYNGKYCILDLPGMAEFHAKYFDEVKKRTGLMPEVTENAWSSEPIADHLTRFDLCLSFYALGEFDDETKKKYLPVLKLCDHGLILWNPHSGASTDIPFECTVTDENPKSGNTDVKQLTW